MATPAVPTVPTPPISGQNRTPPTGKNPFRFLILWFVLPLVAVLVLDALGLPKRLGDWIASLW